MFEPVKRFVLWWLKLPPEPHAPAGAPGSLQVFRAAPNYYRLRLLGWAVSQLSALASLIVALLVLHGEVAQRWLAHHPGLRPVEALVLLLEVAGLMALVLQLPVTYVATRLDYELRWYLVTDRSLRIRSGVWTVEELTMTFANIQEITLHQGPLQRLLGIADLKVRTAGGGAPRRHGPGESDAHVAFFRGVQDAAAIRDRIIARLRRQKDSGLGDPDGPTDEAVPTAPAGVMKAAQEMLSEVRGLRALIEQHD